MVEGWQFDKSKRKCENLEWYRCTQHKTIPERLDAKYYDIHYEFLEIENFADEIIQNFSDKEEYQHYTEKFKKHLDQFESEFDNSDGMLLNFFEIL